jgi:hypothetical protein
MFIYLDFLIYLSLGQKLVEWHQLDVSSFLDQVTGFLGEHGQLDGLSSSPPKKCARSVSISDGQLSIPVSWHFCKRFNVKMVFMTRSRAGFW